MEYLLNNYSIDNEVLDKALYIVFNQNETKNSKSMIDLLTSFGANPANLIKYIGNDSNIKTQNIDYMVELGADPVVLLKLISLRKLTIR